MKNRYEGLLVLDTQGKEDTVKDVIERLEKDFEKEGRGRRAGPENGEARLQLRPAR